MTSTRLRLPNRRPAVTETLEVPGQCFTATIGFDPANAQPREVFLAGAKGGSALAAILADAAVVISVALQHDIPAEALAKSVGRLPGGPVAPADLDTASERLVSMSPIGAALDLVARWQAGITLA
jgi:ribonucleoside-diphosphate reductase alpha chain